MSARPRDAAPAPAPAPPPLGRAAAPRAAAAAAAPRPSRSSGVVRHFDSLPEEALSLILTTLSGWEAARCACVNSTWRRVVACDEAGWRRRFGEAFADASDVLLSPPAALSDWAHRCAELEGLAAEVGVFPGRGAAEAARARCAALHPHPHTSFKRKFHIACSDASGVLPPGWRRGPRSARRATARQRFSSPGATRRPLTRRRRRRPRAAVAQRRRRLEGAEGIPTAARRRGCVFSPCPAAPSRRNLRRVCGSSESRKPGRPRPRRRGAPPPTRPFPATCRASPPLSFPSLFPTNIPFLSLLQTPGRFPFFGHVGGGHQPSDARRSRGAG